MRWMKWALVSAMVTSTASCADLLATPEAATDAICTSTAEARRQHAGALVALGEEPPDRNAKRTGAAVLGGIAAGCGEI
jgi:hypothetical protein